VPLLKYPVIRVSFGGGVLLAEKIRAEVAALRVSIGTSEWRGSASVGAAVRTPEMMRCGALLKAADLGCPTSCLPDAPIGIRQFAA